jgi:hypothetical protein
MQVLQVSLAKWMNNYAFRVKTIEDSTGSAIAA